MTEIQEFFATAPKGMENLLAGELTSFDALDVAVRRGGVSFRGPMETAYRACLWSRTANRILFPVGRFSAPTPEKLYDRIRKISWDHHLRANGTLAVDFFCSESRISHSQYGALKVKDAIVDQFREAYGERPSVDLKHPDLRVNVYLHRNQAVLSLDLSGESLHRRGYRREGTATPLKENLAAAILMRAGWPETFRSGGAFLDPMCGSGTLPIEAALMAADMAPGLLRDRFGFTAWRGHDRSLWERLRHEAEERRHKGLKNPVIIAGTDKDGEAMRTARAGARHFGLETFIRFSKQDISRAGPPARAEDQKGLIVINPPYGKRLGEAKSLEALYERLGRTLKKNFGGWRAAIFTGNPDLSRRIHLRAEKVYSLYNGPIKCALLIFKIHERPST